MIVDDTVDHGHGNTSLEVNDPVDSEAPTDAADTANSEQNSAEDTTVPHGVEKNVESRFVDYTFATPYENLVADLENALKNYLKERERGRIGPSKEIIYEACKFRLSHNDRKIHSRDFPSDIWHWFGCTEFFLLTAEYVGWKETESVRALAFSALATAVQNTDSSIPVFLAPCSLDALKHARDIWGYGVFALRPQKADTGGETSDSSVLCVRQYESSVIDGVDIKSELFYADGL